MWWRASPVGLIYLNLQSFWLNKVFQKGGGPWLHFTIVKRGVLQVLDPSLLALVILQTLKERGGGSDRATATATAKDGGDSSPVVRPRPPLHHLERKREKKKREVERDKRIARIWNVGNSGNFVRCSIKGNGSGQSLLHSSTFHSFFLPF